MRFQDFGLRPSICSPDKSGNLRACTKEMSVTIQFSHELETALAEEAKRRDTSPEALAADILRARLTPVEWPIVPRDDWERRLLAIGAHCGVALSNEALSSEGLYE